MFKISATMASSAHAVLRVWSVYLHPFWR